MMIEQKMRQKLLWGCQAMLIGAIALSAQVQGQVSHQEEIRQATVVYVSGNDLVVKYSTGAVKHFNVPNDYIFHVDGKDVSVKDLKTGTHLTQTITTTTKDTNVTNVRYVDATVWQVNAPHLIVTMADGTNKQVKVPDGTKFTVDGQEKTVFDLRKGMKLKGTVVTTTPETVVTTSSKVTGKTPPVATPRIVGVLLIEGDN